MAKQSIIKDIKAKPNERGRQSNLPLECSVKGCTTDFHFSYMLSYPPKRVCEYHYLNPPQVRVTAKILRMQSMGLI